MRKYLFPLVALGLIAATLSGCVVAPGRGGGWCYYHPWRC
jgi:hypothetical protein